MLEENWVRIKNRLKEELGENAFNNWIKPLTLESTDDLVAKFVVPTVFIGNWVQRNFNDKICACFIAEGIEIDRLVFNVSESKIKNILEKKETLKSGVVVKDMDVALPSSPLDSRFRRGQFADRRQSSRNGSGLPQKTQILVRKK